MFIDPENMGKDTEIWEKTPKSCVVRVSYTDILEKPISVWMSWRPFQNSRWLHTLKYPMLFLLIGFLDPENMGIATKTKFLWVSNTEIVAKPNSAQTRWRPFWNVFFKRWSSGGKFGEFDNLFSMIIWACTKNSACGYFFPGQNLILLY